MNGTATAQRTDTVRIPIVDADPDTTVEFFPPWLLPPVTRRVDRTPPTVRAWRRARSSQYAAEVRAGIHRGLAVMGVLGIAYFALLVARGIWVAAELLGAAMTRDDAVLYGCLLITALSAAGLVLMRSPSSFLSRLVDRPADENTTREVQS